MIGHVGDDSFGRFARQAMAAAGVDCAAIATSHKATGVAVIGVDQSAENQIMVASGANLDSAPDQVPDLELARRHRAVPERGASRSDFRAARARQERGARTILNLAPAGAVPLNILSMLDVLVVNKIEGRMAAGCAGDAEVAAFARDLATTHDLTCVVTLGAEALAIGEFGSARGCLAGRAGGYHRRGRSFRRARRVARPRPRAWQRYGAPASRRA